MHHQNLIPIIFECSNGHWEHTRNRPTENLPKILSRKVKIETEFNMALCHTLYVEKSTTTTDDDDDDEKKMHTQKRHEKA